MCVKPIEITTLSDFQKKFDNYLNENIDKIPIVTKKQLTRTYYDKVTKIIDAQLHEFCKNCIINSESWKMELGDIMLNIDFRIGLKQGRPVIIYNPRFFAENKGEK